MTTTCKIVCNDIRKWNYSKKPILINQQKVSIMKTKQMIFAASEVTIRETLTEPGIYAVRLTGINETNSHLKSNGERVDNIKGEGFVDPNPQYRLEFTIVSGNHSGMKFGAHRQSIAGYLRDSDIDQSIKASITSYLWKTYGSKPKVIDGWYCEFIDEVEAPRSLYDEDTDTMYEDDSMLTVKAGWQRILSVKNTLHSLNILREQLLPSGLLIDHGNNTYSIPEIETLNKMCTEGKSRIFYIELYRDGDYLKLKRTFSSEDIAAKANKDEKSSPETPTIRRRKIEA